MKRSANSVRNMLAALLPFLGDTPAFRIRGNRYRPHEGAQERDRRRRQIERGQLTWSNGLRRGAS